MRISTFQGWWQDEHDDQDESEFRNTRVDELCDELGIKHHFRPSIHLNLMA
jgi:hypothetical protein